MENPILIIAATRRSSCSMWQDLLRNPGIVWTFDMNSTTVLYYIQLWFYVANNWSLHMSTLGLDTRFCRYMAPALFQLHRTQQKEEWTIRGNPPRLSREPEWTRANPTSHSRPGCAAARWHVLGASAVPIAPVFLSSRDHFCGRFPMLRWYGKETLIPHIRPHMYNHIIIISVLMMYSGYGVHQGEFWSYCRHCPFLSCKKATINARPCRRCLSLGGSRSACYPGMWAASVTIEKTRVLDWKRRPGCGAQECAGTLRNGKASSFPSRIFMGCPFTLYHWLIDHQVTHWLVDHFLSLFQN